MSQCLRCSKLCEPTAVFCDECRSLLRYQLRQRPFLYASQHATSSSSDDPPTLPEHLGVQGDPLERMTSPLPSNRVNELAEPPALTAQPDLIEQAVTRLNEAAHLIEQEEDQSKNDRKPRLYSRASRLSPIVVERVLLYQKFQAQQKALATLLSWTLIPLCLITGPGLKKMLKRKRVIYGPIVQTLLYLVVFLLAPNRRVSRKRICGALWRMVYQQLNFPFHLCGVILLVYVSPLLPLRFLRSWLS